MLSGVIFVDKKSIHPLCIPAYPLQGQSCDSMKVKANKTNTTKKLKERVDILVWVGLKEAAVFLNCLIVAVHNCDGLLFMFQGKGLFAKKSIKKGDTIFFERPLVSAQFLWSTLYKYRGEMSTI